MLNKQVTDSSGRYKTQKFLLSCKVHVTCVGRNEQQVYNKALVVMKTRNKNRSEAVLRVAELGLNVSVRLAASYGRCAGNCEGSTGSNTIPRGTVTAVVTQGLTFSSFVKRKKR
jgi:hypothetical protein